VEFGHKVFLAESAQGLITDYRVLKGNPVDSDHVEASLERHQQTFQHPPNVTQEIAVSTASTMCNAVIRLRSARCASATGREKDCGAGSAGAQPRIQESAKIPGRHRRPYLRVVSRSGMKRCRAKGRERFEMLVGAAVLANNLMRIAQLIEDRKPNRRRVAA